MRTEARQDIRALALLFLKLGTIAFGGPAAHIAMMEDEVVRRRGWLTREEFLDYLGATNLIPGPNSTELAIHIGRERAGWAGLLVAGACFILPAACIVMAIAWAYVRFGALPAAVGILYGVKPVVIAVVVQALLGLGRAALKTRGLIVLAVAATVAAMMGMNELLILFGAGAVAVAVRGLGDARRSQSSGAAAVVGGAATKRAGAAALVAGSVTTQAGTALAVPFGLWPMFAVFLKIGSVLFGSGYVLLAFLRADFVERLHWLTEQQLLDAIAVGQVTPGPVFTTATFIGYLLGRGPGAAVATAGIFLPAFIFVALSSFLVPRLRRSRIAGAVLDGVNVASLALMAVVTVQLARGAIVDVATVLLAVASGVLLMRYRTSSAWLVGAGAIVGLLIR
jgi:chromate transporter